MLRFNSVQGASPAVLLPAEAPSHGVPLLLGLPLEVQTEYTPGQGQHPRVNQGRVNELAAAGLRVGVSVHVIALVDHAGNGHQLTVEGRLPHASSGTRTPLTLDQMPVGSAMVPRLRRASWS